MQLARRKPELDAAGVGLTAVGIGTPEKAALVADHVGFPADLLLADPENAVYDALRLNAGVGRTFFNPATPYRRPSGDGSRRRRRGERRRVATPPRRRPGSSERRPASRRRRGDDLDCPSGDGSRRRRRGDDLDRPRSAWRAAS